MSEQLQVGDNATVSDQYARVESVAGDRDGDGWCLVAIRDVNAFVEPTYRVERGHE